MLRRLGVRGKILATLAVPIFVLALAASWITWQSWRESRTAGQTAELMQSLELQDTAGSAVAAERGLSIAASMGLPGAKKQLVSAQEASDRGLDARDDELESLNLSSLTANVQDTVERTLDDRTTMDEVQRSVIAGQITELRATEEYTALSDRALDVPRSVAQSSTDDGLVDRIGAYTALDEAMLANTLERPLVAAVLAQTAAGEEVDPDLLSRMVTALQRTDSLRTEAQNRLDELPGEMKVPSYGDDLEHLRLQLRYLNFSGIDPEVAGGWQEMSQGWVDDTQAVRDDVRNMTVQHAEGLDGDAQRAAGLTALGALIVVVGSFLLALLIARRIVQPLRRLTSATGDVRERLPQMVEQMAVPGQSPAVELVQVPVESTDEIGRLAAAFNDVNETTMVVAREQAALRGSIAEMFVNVARRDQVLLNRQLAFLDELERSEEDPGTLSNLFRLDHLATRMRRNAESLLVLAGIDSGRRVRNPMPISDVVRTASSEIELYDRVRLDLAADPHMLGHNALNAAHLIAELLENATMFSEPHTPVEVITAHDERGVLVTVRDHGLGMNPEELAEANARVSRAAASDAVGAQRLGLYVVARLAGRLGASVGVRTGESGTGTEVSVLFPAVLFLPDDALPLPQPTDPLETGTQATAAGLAGVPGAVGALEAPSVPEVPVAEAPATPVVPERPTDPAPVATAPESASQSSGFAPSGAFVGVAEPEPPAAVPVDLDALTDGTTSLGMPRRKRSADAEVGRDVEQARPHGWRPDTGPIVLPPLETPSLPDGVEDTAVAAWQPPTTSGAGATSLPSRRSRPETAPAPAVEPEPVSAPILDVEQRTGLFSGFRSMENLDVSDTESTLQLDAVTEDPAAVPDELAPLEPAAAVPAQPVPAEPMPPMPAEPAAEATDVAASPFAPVVDAVPAAELPVRDVPTPEVSAWQEPAPVAARRPSPAVPPTSAPEPVTSTINPVPMPAPVPVAEAEPTVRPVADPPPFAPVPAASQAPTEAPVDSAPAAPAPAGEALPAFEDLIADLPTRRATREAGRKRGLFGRKPSAETPGSGTPAPAGDGLPPVTDVPVPHRAPQPAAYTPPAPTPSSAQEPAVAPRPAAVPEDDPRSSTSYGGSVLPLRSTESGGDPLDPHYVPDTIEARSEWMASAVLYEEMSALLQRGVFQEGNVTSTNDEQTYRPAAVATDSSAGLTRRSRSGATGGTAERFTAQIDRDPEQLRARLSAFQSATNRGRTDAIAVTPSTNPPRP